MCILTRAFTRKTLTGAAFLAAASLGATASQAIENLPSSMTWSAYDVGSSGYVEASAVADALMREHDVRIRIMPSGTSIGRLLPLRTGRVNFGWLANEVYFATEAIYEFASQEWGPQDLRVLLGRPAGFGIGVAGDADVANIEDLRGKRVARVQANPSINIKVEAIMALAGLTWDDVDVVDVPSYAASLRGLVEGTIDAAGTVPTAATLRELEASPRGLVWPDMPAAEDEEAWDRLREVAPIFEAMEETIGAGLSEDNPATLISYRYPMITVYAEMSDEEAYAVTKAVVEAFDLYRDVNPAMPRWDAQLSGRPPADAPFHPGAIRYLEEIGIWTDDDTSWNQTRQERLDRVIEAWESAMEQALEEQIPGGEWEGFWMNYRDEHLN
jgi:uncharacterized protein